MLVSLSYEKLIFWKIQNGDLQSLYEFNNISLIHSYDCLLAINGYLLVGENNRIRVFNYTGRRITFSFFYENDEFGRIYSMKYLGNNYFICGRSFGFCSLFLFRENTKTIRKINIFRNNNLKTSDKNIDEDKDDFLINNICICKTSSGTGNILISSVDKTLKVISIPIVKMILLINKNY